MNKILLSAILGFTLATPHPVFASQHDTHSFTEEQCNSLYRIKFWEKVLTATGLVLLLVADFVRSNEALEKKTVSSAILLFSLIAYEMANTPFRAERVAYCRQHYPQ